MVFLFDLINRLSIIDEAPAKPKIRPKSMIARLSDGLINTGISGSSSDRASQKRQSWYQGKQDLETGVGVFGTYVTYTKLKQNAFK